jgi:hypothetical protein
MSENEEDSFLRQVFVTRTNGYVDVFPKRDLWKAVAEKFNGDFSINHNSGMEIETLKLKMVLNNRIVTFAESDTRSLKSEIEFRSVGRLSFNAGIPDFFDKVLIWFGMKHLETKNDHFNKKFIVKTNNRIEAEQFFSTSITKAILEAKVGNISFTTNERKHKSVLVVTFSRSVKTESDFEKIIKLLQEIIGQLNSIKITIEE